MSTQKRAPFQAGTLIKSIFLYRRVIILGEGQPLEHKIISIMGFEDQEYNGQTRLADSDNDRGESIEGSPQLGCLSEYNTAVSI